MTETLAPVRQHLVIRGWHPSTNVNGSNSKGHWSVIRKRHDIDRDTAWASAKQAGWVFMPGKVRLTITLVYPRNTLPDSDNAYAKCKGIIDGLTGHKAPTLAMLRGSGPVGFFEDDDTEHLELIVRAEVEKGVKEVRITLEPAPC